MGFNRRFLAVAIVVAGLFVIGAGQAFADSITYDIVDYADDQDGWTLSGTITTDGTIGTLADTNIEGWEFTITDGTDTYSLDSDSGTVFVGGTVVASANAITVDNDDSSGSYLYMNGSDTLWDIDSDTPLLFYYREPTFEQYTAWEDFDDGFSWNAFPPAMGGTDPWVIATNPVPEPSSLALFGLGLAGAVIYRRRRSTQTS